MRRTDEWGRIVGLLPLDQVFQIDYRLLSNRLAEIPDDANELLRLLDGKRTLAQVIENAGVACGEDLAGARILSKLLAEKIIRPVERNASGNAGAKGPPPLLPGARAAGPHDLATEAEGPPGRRGPGGGEHWFAEPMPAPARADGGRADPRTGGDPAPRIVRFPAKRRDPRRAPTRRGEDRPSRGPEAAPSPGAPPVSDAVEQASARTAAAPRPPATPGAGVHGPAKKRALAVALLVAGSALAGAGIGAWKVFASRPAAPAESTPPAATSISTPAPSPASSPAGGKK